MDEHKTFHVLALPCCGSAPGQESVWGKGSEQELGELLGAALGRGWQGHQGQGRELCPSMQPGPEAATAAGGSGEGKQETALSILSLSITAAWPDSSWQAALWFKQELHLFQKQVFLFYPKCEARFL